MLTSTNHPIIPSVYLSEVATMSYFWPRINTAPMEREEKKLEALDAALENRISHMIRMVMSNREHGSGSLDSLVFVIQCLGESNKDVVRVLLRSKKEIHGSRELLELLQDYFNCSHTTHDFLNTLHLWLHGGNGVSRQLDRVKSRLHDYKMDKTSTSNSSILLQSALQDFMVATNDATSMEKLRAKLGVALDEQKKLYEKLMTKKKEVDQRTIGRCKVYRRVTTAILVSVYVGLMACAAVSAVLSPMVVPPLAALAAIAAMNPTDAIRRGANYMWGKYEDKLKRRSELVNVLMGLAKSQMTVKELEEMRPVVHELSEKMKSLPVNDKVAVKDPEVKTMIEDMERKIKEFSKAVEDLEAKKKKCYNDIIDAKKKIIRTTWG